VKRNGKPETLSPAGTFCRSNRDFHSMRFKSLTQTNLKTGADHEILLRWRWKQLATDLSEKSVKFEKALSFF